MRRYRGIERMAGKKSHIGKVQAPWQFLLFVGVAVVGGAVAGPALGWVHGIMVAFDVASITFALLCVRIFKLEAEAMREKAEQNDADRSLLLIIAMAVTGVVLASVANELAQQGRPKPLDIALVISTLGLCWLFGTLVFALHYAHLFYTRNNQGKDSGGLCFPGTEEPNYWDFLYFAACVAMTFQTADTNITSSKFRRIVTLHGVIAFVFNLGIIAFSINILGGGK